MMSLTKRRISLTRTGTTFEFGVYMTATDTLISGCFTRVGETWKILNVHKGDSIKFIFDNDVDNILSLPITYVGNDIISGGRVMESRYVRLTEKLWERFLTSTSIRCKVGSSYRYTFTEEDLHALHEVWSTYESMKNEK